MLLIKCRIRINERKMAFSGRNKIKRKKKQMDDYMASIIGGRDTNHDTR
jgi:hypothetical protein